MTKTAIAAATLGVLLTGGAAFAQNTYQTGSPGTANPNAGYQGTTGAGGAAATGTTPGTGVPNTGAGGNAPLNAALIAGAAAVALVGAAFLARRTSA